MPELPRKIGPRVRGNRIAARREIGSNGRLRASSTALAGPVQRQTGPMSPGRSGSRPDLPLANRPAVGCTRADPPGRTVVGIVIALGFDFRIGIAAVATGARSQAPEAAECLALAVAATRKGAGPVRQTDSPLLARAGIPACVGARQTITGRIALAGVRFRMADLLIAAIALGATLPIPAGAIANDPPGGAAEFFPVTCAIAASAFATFGHAVRATVGPTRARTRWADALRSVPFLHPWAGKRLWRRRRSPGRVAMLQFGGASDGRAREYGKAFAQPAPGAAGRQITGQTVERRSIHVESFLRDCAMAR